MITLNDPGKTPPVILLRDRYVAGGDSDGASMRKLPDVLRLGFTTDAHWQAGTSAHGRRLTSAGLAEAPAVMGVLAFDLDGPGHAAPLEWRIEEEVRIAAAFDVVGRGYAYATRGGYRIVWRLGEAVVIATPEDARQWSRNYLETLAHLEGRHGLRCDPACADFSRLFRAPHATRDGELQRGSHLGDADAIGALRIEITAADRARARELAPRIFESRSAPQRPLRAAPPQGPATSSVVPAGLLLRLCDAAGLVLGPSPRGGVLIRCPRAELHTTGHDGDGSTIVYAPRDTGGYGAVSCLHASCAGLTCEDWLAELRGEEQLTRRVVRIVGVGIDEPLKLCLELMPADTSRALPLKYLRIHPRPFARWDAIFAAADLETPDPDNLSDSKAQAHWLRGEVIVIEHDERGAVRRILPAAPSKGVAA